MHVDIELPRPNILTKTLETDAHLLRQRARKFRYPRGVCQQGDYREAKDENGHHIVHDEKTEWGNVVAPK